jgi:DNA polymerase elongation subunit (family B)
MKFFTNVSCQGNYIYYRGIDNGRRVRMKMEYAPTLFVPDAGGVASGFLTAPADRQWKNLQGNPVSPMKFDSIFDAREFVKNYEDVESFTIYGNSKFEYAFIADQHPESEIHWNLDSIVTAFIDIEVGSDGGMPDVELANNPVTAITVKFSNDGKYYVFGWNDYTPHREDIVWTRCENEFDLLDKFMALWRERSPDIITGWNVKTFDIPYLINRMVATDGMGEERARWLSPWGRITRKEEEFYGKPVTTYRLLGLATLDYLQLYRKYAKNANQESFKLDHIAHVELKERKLDYSEYDSLHTLYRDNYQKFIEYNIHDVQLVERLNAKGRLIDLAILLAYDNKTNYEDCFTQVRMWDCICYNWLRARGIVVPPNKHSHKDKAYEGAYVKAPLIGMFHSIMGLDATSLYPHIQMQYNMSPETLIEPENYTDAMREVLAQGVNVESMLNRKLNLSALEHCTLTPNGQFFDTRKVGFLPEILQTMFESRVIYKNKQIDAQRERETCTDPERKAELAALISRYENLQLAKKVGLNSAYGALGSEYFRYFDIRIAEGVTLAGQLSIRWIGNHINRYLNMLLDTLDVDYVIASDTDSVYLHLDPLVKRVFRGERDTTKIINFMDQVYKTKLKKVLDTSCQELADYTHAFAQKMNMKREALADVGIWTAKKRYVLNVCDSEGVRYKEPKMLIHGLEAIKSSTPSLVREKIKEALKIILMGTEPELVEFVAQFKKEFASLPISDIAFPRGCNGMEKYRNKDGTVKMQYSYFCGYVEEAGMGNAIYLSGTPIHVKGALIFNHWLKKLKLNDQYELIQNGEKVKFVLLKPGNMFDDSVLSFIRRIPKEFELEKQVDYDMQFEKTFREPLNIVLAAIDWHSEPQYNLEDFFS